MIRLLIFFLAMILAWQLFRMLNRKATLEEARTIGLQQASLHINNPILLEDYTETRGIPMEALESMIEQGGIPSYRWRQFIYIENRELVFSNK
ncbi:MAG: hypothetical protein HRU20_23880 [Pseudomonadales bacterium]|nr:hypothetical protein [Pseudomonadales bacterium]